MKSGKKHKLLIAVVVAALFLTMMFPASVFARNGAENGNGGNGGSGGNAGNTGNAAVNDAEFTVQYYAGIPSYSTSGDEDNALSIIDTTGENEQPANEDGSNVKTRKLYLDENGQFKWEYSLSAIYTEESYSYYTAPGLNYFDKVSHSSANYDLREVWIMKASCPDPQSIKWSDWTMYQDVDKYPLQFTNDPAAVQNTQVQEDQERPDGDVVPVRRKRVRREHGGSRQTDLLARVEREEAVVVAAAVADSVTRAVKDEARNQTHRTHELGGLGQGGRVRGRLENAHRPRRELVERAYLMEAHGMRLRVGARHGHAATRGEQALDQGVGTHLGSARDVGEHERRLDEERKRHEGARDRGVALEAGPLRNPATNAEVVASEGALVGIRSIRACHCAPSLRFNVHPILTVFGRCPFAT